MIYMKSRKDQEAIIDMWKAGHRSIYQPNKNKMPNNEFAKTDQKFLEACEKAGVEPTTRQASKYRNKHGLAFQNR